MTTKFQNIDRICLTEIGLKIIEIPIAFSVAKMTKNGDKNGDKYRNVDCICRQKWRVKISKYRYFFISIFGIFWIPQQPSRTAQILCKLGHIYECHNSIVGRNRGLLGIARGWKGIFAFMGLCALMVISKRSNCIYYGTWIKLAYPSNWNWTLWYQSSQAPTSHKRSKNISTKSIYLYR